MGSLVGRERALAQARTALDETLGGSGRLLLLCGEPGIGKTALLAELAADVEARGVRVLRGTCWDGTGTPVFWPWMQVLRAAGAELGELVPGPGGADDPGARFALFDAVTRLLAGWCPLAVVLDDLQWADEPSLRLLDFAARRLAGSRVLLVGGYRDAEAGPALRRVAGAGQLLPLAGLTRDEVGALMTVVSGTRPADAAAADVWRRTGGNPFFVREVTRLLLIQGDERTVPDTARDTCERRLARLSQPCADLLATAAVAGIELRPDLLTRLHRAADVPELVDEAVRARVLVAEDAGGHRFAHDLFRETVETALPSAELEQRHAAVGRALEALREAGAEVHVAELAAHFLAGPATEAGAAVRYAVAAAVEAVSQLGHEDAVRHYERALAAHDRLDPPDPAGRVRVLLGLADARNRAGDAGTARTMCDRAAELARRTGDTEGLASAALTRYALGARTPSAHAANIALLTEAAEALPSGPSVQRARVLTGLVGSRRHGLVDPDPADLVDTAEEAVRVARAVADPAALAAALLALHDAVWRPGTARRRLEILDEMRGATVAASDPEQVARTHQLRAAALIELGDPRGRAELETYARLADQLGTARGRWEALSRRATLAVLLGRVAEADELARQGYALGRAIGEPDAIGVYGTLCASMLLLAPSAALPLPDPALEVSAPLQLAVPLLRTAGLLIRGEPDAARDELAGYAMDQLPVTIDLELLAIAASVVIPVGSDGQRTQLVERLRPYRGLHVVVGGAASYWGAVDHHLGMLTAALGHREEAVHLLGSAMESYERLGAPEWAQRCRAELDRLPATPANHPVFQQDGPTWTLAFGGISVHLPDAKGLQDIATLLAIPGRVVPATVLLGGPARPSGADPVLDRTAKEAYRARLARLDAEIDEAETWSDPHRADRARTERDALVRELAAAAGLGGRDRRLGDEAERARKTVTARIRDSLSRIERVHPARYAGEYEDTRTSRSSFARVGSLTAPVTVDVTGGAQLTTDGLSEDPSVSTQDWVQIEPGLFRVEGGTATIALDDHGALVSSQTPAASYVRLDWYRSPQLHLLVAGAALSVLLLGFFLFPIQALVRRHFLRPRRSAGSRSARVLAWATSLCAVLFGAAFGVISSDANRLMQIALTGDPVLSFALNTVSVMGVLTVAVAVCAVVAWRRTWWTRAGRIAYSGYALAAVGFLGIAVTYRLLGAPLTLTV